MTLRDAIREEMVTDAEDVLEAYFEQVKKVVRLNEEGRIFLDGSVRDRMSSKEQIRLYLVGKHYAEKAGFAETNSVTNKELEEQLEKPSGTVQWALTELRKENSVKRVKNGEHEIPANMVRGALKELGVIDND